MDNKNVISRGSQQQYWLSLMLTASCPSPERTLRGRAKLYACRYRESFHHLLARMRTAGYEITRTPGVRGGEWGATYSARMA